MFRHIFPPQWLAPLALLLFAGCSPVPARKQTYRFPPHTAEQDTGPLMAHYMEVPVTVGADWFRDHDAGEYFFGVRSVAFHTDLFGDSNAFTKGKRFQDDACKYFRSAPVPLNRDRNKELVSRIFTADLESNDILDRLLEPLALAIGAGRWTEDPFYDPSQPDPGKRKRTYSALCTLNVSLEPEPGVKTVLGNFDDEMRGALHVGICQLSPDETNVEPVLVLFNSHNLTEVLILDGPESVTLLKQLRALYDRIQELVEERK